MTDYLPPEVAVPVAVVLLAAVVWQRWPWLKAWLGL